jgi:hypothetical protein
LDFPTQTGMMCCEIQSQRMWQRNLLFPLNL